MKVTADCVEIRLVFAGQLGTELRGVIRILEARATADDLKPIGRKVQPSPEALKNEKYGIAKKKIE